MSDAASPRSEGPAAIRYDASPAAPISEAPAAAPTYDAPRAAPTYEAACARIEEIIKRLDTGQAGLRETLELCQEGRRLVEFCASELEAVGRGLEELRLDELVARLESGRGSAPAA
jgi:exodeoxyribonuclease VII small subunit